jgi:hypothetical protein
MEAAVTRQCIRALALAAAIGLLSAGGGPAQAGQPRSPFLDVQSAARLSPDGQSVTVDLLASCPLRWTVVEAVVSVSQPQASGQASFSFPCIDSIRAFSVTVPSAGGTFVLDDAQANASVLIKRGRTERIQDAEVVDVQPTVFVDLADTARLESGGGAVTIEITVACPVGANGQQSYVNVSQGQTASGNANYVPVCDGERHTFSVRVQASQGVYQAGDARALTFANVEHEGNGFSGLDDSPIQIVT